MATASPPGPSQLADTAAITLPKIDAIASGAVKDALKTGMSESEEVLEYLGGSVAYDLKAAAAKAATRRDLALGPKSKLDGAALNASLDELDLRAKLGRHHQRMGAVVRFGRTRDHGSAFCEGGQRDDTLHDALAWRRPHAVSSQCAR